MQSLGASDATTHATFLLTFFLSQPYVTDVNVDVDLVPEPDLDSDLDSDPDPDPDPNPISDHARTSSLSFSRRVSTGHGT